MKLEVHRISPDGETVEATSPLPEVEMGHSGVWFNNPVHLRMKVSVVDKRVIAMGSYESSVTLECHRCLRHFEYPIRTADYIWEQPVKLSCDEIIDLTEGIREDIILRLPLKNLCRQDCKGLCPKCGKHLNEGPCRCQPVRQPSAFADLDTLIQDEGEKP